MNKNYSFGEHGNVQNGRSNTVGAVPPVTYPEQPSKASCITSFVILNSTSSPYSFVTG